MSVEVLDDMIRREAQLQRLATYLIRQYVNPTVQELAVELPRLLVGFEDLPRALQQQIAADIQRRTERGWQAMWLQINEEFSGMMADEAAFTLQFYDDYAPEQIIPLRNLPSLDDSLMIVSNQAGTWSEFVRRNIDDTMRQVNGVVMRGLVEGQTLQQVTQQLRGTYNRRTKEYSGGILDGVQARRAEALVRTGMSHHANQVRDRFAQANRNVINRRIFFATLDSRTTAQCLSNHLREWSIDDDEYPRLPLHFNERSVYIFGSPGFNPLDTTRPAETGRDVDPDKYNKRRNRGKEFEQVDAQLSAEDWLSRQPRWFIEQSLGKTRAELFIDGKLSIKSMVDIANRPLTLAQLRDTTAGARAFRRIGE